MSPCNMLRFFAVSTIVMSIAGSPVPGNSNRHKNIVTRDVTPDLVHQGSLTVELKNQFKSPSDINSLKLNNAKNDVNTIPRSLDVSKNSGSKASTTISKNEAVTLNVSNSVDKTTKIPLESSTKNIDLNLNTTTNEKLLDPQSEVTNKSNENNLRVLQPLNTHNQTTNNNDQMSKNNTTKKANEAEVTTVENKAPTEVTLSVTAEKPNSNQSIGTENGPSGTETTTSNNNVTITETFAEPMEMSSTINDITSPTGKKYTVIERKRVLTTTEEPTSTDTSIIMNNVEITVPTISKESGTVTDKTEVMVKSETAQSRVSLQDAITSDIPSLEKLKTDLLSYPKFTTKSDFDSSTVFTPTKENLKSMEITTSILTTLTSATNSELPNTVSSKRAGYLDLSSIAKDSKTENLIGLKANGTESLQGPFDAETPDLQDEPDDKIDTKVESQGQLNEDAIKEELLKEEIINDNEENAKRHKDEQLQISMPPLPDTGITNTTKLNETLVLPAISAPDDNLSVKPINSDKSKNTVLYPVNPNYKPLKKIEVQPAKPFVRDPDDNSWRNESLSSLGIVFNPKNSSKPFTQVLKNKTESEWNNLPEKDRKNEVPDLRVRLEQIAQKRKSKKKKIDSSGNVFYTDYEENSSSEERREKSSENTTLLEKDTTVAIVSTTEVPPTTDITIVTPIQTTSISTTIKEVIATSALTTVPTPTNNTQTTVIPKTESIKMTTPKTKVFNIFDYYESNDDDDIADYLNMAKIDLKKYTVPIPTTFSTFTSPPIPILYTHPMSQYTSERKGTIQYFPPRTTKRPRKNKQNNNIRHKINSLPEAPKTVLPISFSRLPTTPFDNMYYTSGPSYTRVRGELEREDGKKFDRNPYLTTPPLTTLPDEGFGVISHDGYRTNYMMKPYKDFMPETGDTEPGRDRANEFGYTQPPAPAVTVTELVKGTTMKDAKTTEEYDYESEFRKDVIERFVANFNENTKRFNSDFPLLYNNSIVHGPGYSAKDVALSRAYFRRPDSGRGEYKPITVDPYDPNCENVTLELSPAYELHYYVPEQEEKQEVEAKPLTQPIPIPYRL